MAGVIVAFIFDQNDVVVDVFEKEFKMFDSSFSRYLIFDGWCNP